MGIAGAVISSGQLVWLVNSLVKLTTVTHCHGRQPDHFEDVLERNQGGMQESFVKPLGSDIRWLRYRQVMYTLCFL